MGGGLRTAWRVVVRGATANVHAPGGWWAIHVGRGGPVVVRLRSNERMSRGKRRKRVTEIDETQQLPDVRQPPVTCYRAIHQPARAACQAVRVGQSSSPTLAHDEAVCILQPDQARQIVFDCPIPPVREPWGHRSADLVLAILSRPGTSDG